jgi:hypothetical protein
MSKDLTQKLNGSLEDKIDWLITAVQSVDSRLANVVTRLESLEIKVDERMKETRPMWEALQAQLTELNTSQDRGFRRFDHAMDQVTGNQTRLHADNVELESRVYKIEKRINE